MRHLIQWRLDPQTEQAARDYPIVIQANLPKPQFEGYDTNAKTWNDRVTQPAEWPTDQLKSCPNQIITFLKSERYTQGLAMVVSWGGMGRRSKDIYGQPRGEKIKKIEQTLRECAERIQLSQSIAEPWMVLTGQLGWSAVLTSKTLHFLCRSLGFEQNPPVAIDNACIREKVWPAFRDGIPDAQRPGNWEGNTFEAYCRYMTAIITWSKLRDWTTTQMEATIFFEFMN
jgi:hypothetical protein